MQSSVFSGSLDPAGEQFIRNTPWANPQHPRHQRQNNKGYAGEGDGAPAPAPRLNGQSHQQSPLEKLSSSKVAPSATEMMRTASSSGKGKRVSSLQGASGTSSKPLQETVKHDTALAVGS